MKTNEHIEALIKKCERTHTEYYDGRGNVTSTHFDRDKFAELIVQECCDIFVELRTRPADLAVMDVKKHFGIKGK